MQQQQVQLPCPAGSCSASRFLHGVSACAPDVTPPPAYNHRPAVYPDAVLLATSSAVCSAAVDPPKTITVAVTSDKGLCGGLNSNITKYTKALMQMYKGSGECFLLHQCGWL